MQPELRFSTGPAQESVGGILDQCLACRQRLVSWMWGPRPTLAERDRSDLSGRVGVSRDADRAPEPVAVGSALGEGTPWPEGPGGGVARWRTSLCVPLGAMCSVP